MYLNQACGTGTKCLYFLLGLIVLCLKTPSCQAAAVIGQDESSSSDVTNGTKAENVTAADDKTHHHFIIGVISDNDEKSKSKTKPKTWESKFIRGKLIWDEKTRKFDVHFDVKNTKTLRSGFSAGGRGMELSELIYYDTVLTAFDDKTGIVYRIENGDVYPWVILQAGDGKLNKGFKSEWAAVKNGQLIVGSHGTRINSATNQRVAEEMQWVKIISSTGLVQHMNWTENYAKVQNSTECTGYVTHEAVCWSELHAKWYFLPRKCSTEAYSKDSYDIKSSNILISTDENFSEFLVTRVGKSIPSQGFSSFKFLPGSNDSIIVALKTMEVRTYYKTHIAVYSVEGETLLEDTLVSESDKFEGLEFIHEYDPILSYEAPPSHNPSSAVPSYLAQNYLILISIVGVYFSNQIK